MEDNNRQQDYEKEQYLGLATFARAVAGVIVGLGIFIPFFKGGLFIPKQFIMALGIGAIWLTFAADLVALAYQKPTEWTLRFYPIIIVIWFAFWLMK